MAQMQTLREAVARLWETDPEAADAAIDYLADLGRADVILTMHGPQLVLA